MEEVPCRTSCAPLAYLFYMFILIGLEAKRRLAFQLRATWDRFRCTVESSPSHIIRCRTLRLSGKNLLGPLDVRVHTKGARATTRPSKKGS